VVAYEGDGKFGKVEIEKNMGLRHEKLDVCHLPIGYVA
jgi:hypothetical protein